MTLDFTKLTRRAYRHRPDCWRIYCGDICTGWIAKASTTNGQAVWQWNVNMYPGSRPGEGYGGSADTFEDTKAKFLPAWLAFASSRTAEDFAEWRDHRDITAWKYQMHDQGMPMPTQSQAGRARCFCGSEITIASVVEHVRAAHQEAST